MRLLDLSVDEIKLEPEYCDDCGEIVGHYDPRLPPGEKIVLTRVCSCWRELARRNGSARQ